MWRRESHVKMNVHRPAGFLDTAVVAADHADDEQPEDHGQSCEHVLVERIGMDHNGSDLRGDCWSSGDVVHVSTLDWWCRLRCMKSSTTRKTKKNETPRLITDRELAKLTLQVYRFPEGWVVTDHNYAIKSTHRTQAEAAESGRVLAKKRSGRLLVRGKNGLIRKREYYWTGPVRFEPPKLLPPHFPPKNASRKAIEKAVKAAIREVNAEAARQKINVS